MKGRSLEQLRSLECDETSQRRPTMSRSRIEHGSGRGLATLLRVAATLAAALMSSIGVAAADYTACTLPRPACTAYPVGTHPTVVALKDFNCTSDPNGNGPLL